MAEKFYKSALRDFKEVSKRPVDIFDAPDYFTDKLKTNLKKLYDFSANVEQSNYKFTVLPHLEVSDLDLEQIWQQLELKNAKILNTSVNQVSHLTALKNRLAFKKGDRSEDSSNEESEDIEDNVEMDQTISSTDNESFKSDEGNQKDVNGANTKPGSIVDDQFFKMSEMEEFLKQEERNADKQSKSDSESDDSEGSIDLFEEDNEDSESEAKMAKFKNYFVKQDSDQRNKKGKEVLLSDNDVLDTESKKSTLELRQQRLSHKIDEIEDEAVSDKPWQLKGEVMADNRPQNSLLEEILEFDLTSRPAPIITEQTSLRLEDIIRQRIKDKIFDDVEKKVKHIETLPEYKKKLVLNQEKSKESLAQIYERQYLDQVSALDPQKTNKDEEEPEVHKEVRKMMQTLFNKLDALSNFHFTSKPAIPELKIISSLPALAMEEVAPVVASSASLLAPDEIRNKSKKQFMGESEKTTTDRKRERRKKKIKQKLHSKFSQAKKGILKNTTTKKAFQK